MLEPPDVGRSVSSERLLLDSVMNVRIGVSRPICNGLGYLTSRQEV